MCTYRYSRTLPDHRTQIQAPFEGVLVLLLSRPPNAATFGPAVRDSRTAPRVLLPRCLAPGGHFCYHNHMKRGTRNLVSGSARYGNTGRPEQRALLSSRTWCGADPNRRTGEYSLKEQGRCMSTQRDVSGPNTDRDLLLKRMQDARDSGNSKEVEGVLNEAKSWLRDNRVGDNAVRDAQFRLLRAYPPTR
jgi:hypothetical protein